MSWKASMQPGWSSNAWAFWTPSTMAVLPSCLACSMSAVLRARASKSPLSRISRFIRAMLATVPLKSSHTETVQLAPLRPPLRMSSKTGRSQWEMIRPSKTNAFWCKLLMVRSFRRGQECGAGGSGVFQQRRKHRIGALRRGDDAGSVGLRAALDQAPEVVGKTAAQDQQHAGLVAARHDHGGFGDHAADAAARRQALEVVGAQLAQQQQVIGAGQAQRGQAPAVVHDLGKGIAQRGVQR